MDTKKLEERAEQLKTQFEQYMVQEQQIVEAYNKKIEELRLEGEQTLQKVQSAKEQVRGAYTEIMYILHPELLPDEGTVEDEDSVKVTTQEESVEEPVVEDTVTVSTEPVDIHGTEESFQLTEEELQKIAQSMEAQDTGKVEEVKVETESKSAKKSNNKVKEEDIPDYLKEEYK